MHLTRAKTKKYIIIQIQIISLHLIRGLNGRQIDFQLTRLSVDPVSPNKWLTIHIAQDKFFIEFRFIFTDTLQKHFQNRTKKKKENKTAKFWPFSFHYHMRYSIEIVFFLNPLPMLLLRHWKLQ